jgi:hypothetical protein
MPRDDNALAGKKAAFVAESIVALVTAGLVAWGILEFLALPP